MEATTLPTPPLPPHTETGGPSNRNLRRNGDISYLRHEDKTKSLNSMLWLKHAVAERSLVSDQAVRDGIRFDPTFITQRQTSQLDGKSGHWTKQLNEEHQAFTHIWMSSRENFPK